MSDRPAPLPPDFDPDGASGSDGNLFGLPTSTDTARVVVIPVPFEATVSYGVGAASAPQAILQASQQVDLHDAQTEHPYRHGIAMDEIPDDVRRWSDEARAVAEPVIEAGGPEGSDELMERVRGVDALCERLNDWVRGRVGHWLDQDRIAIVLGGDHSVPFGAFQAYAERFPGFGMLHVDAHFDLRAGYEGFAWSHASILWNALTRIPDIANVVHVGIRDFGEGELAFGRGVGERSIPFLETHVRDRLADGETWRAVADEIVAHLPQEVYVSFDIDGLDPTLCPGTGTPVPGGLSFYEATSLLDAVVRSGRTIIGADLCEVAPAPGDREWNANVGARVLYKLIGFALKSQA